MAADRAPVPAAPETPASPLSRPAAEGPAPVLDWVAVTAGPPATPAAPARSGRGFTAMRAALLLGMQQSLGNRAVQRYLQRTAGGTPAAAPAAVADEDLAARIRQAPTGTPLAAPTQQRLEQGLGAELSAVRVHTDGEADSLARAVEATAFTTGPDIFFRAGAYDPSSSGGMQVLAHEVAHTVQQAAGSVTGTAGPGGVLISDPADRFEHAADQIAQRTVASDADPMPTSSATASPPGGELVLQLLPADQIHVGTKYLFVPLDGVARTGTLTAKGGGGWYTFAGDDGRTYKVHGAAYIHALAAATTATPSSSTSVGQAASQPAQVPNTATEEDDSSESETMEVEEKSTAAQGPGLGLTDQSAYNPNKRVFHREGSFQITQLPATQEVNADEATEYRVSGSAIHQKLHASLYGGMSENVVSAGVTIVWRSGGQFGQQNQPLAGSWQSGGLAQQNTQLLAMLQTVGHKGATTPEKVYHSEQAMVLDWSHDPQPLLNACNQAVQAAGLQAGDEVLLVIIEVHSHVRGVCNNCARTLRSMIDGGWGQQFKLACTQANFLCDSLKFLLRTSADETFSTGGAAEGQRKAKEKEKKGQVVSYAWGELPWEHHQLPWNENTGELWKPPEKKGEGEQDDDF